ncbi:MAG TPA: peptide chain release factor N(5)-glutamine methyltransferase [Paludibacteraceae bacterium]|nr:peptide chain release factor N(5)-glutamine methyltransferase [Paludibacteraceae bacterium]
MQHFLKKLNTSLADMYSEAELHMIANLLLENITGLSRVQLLSNKDLILNDEKNILADRYLLQLKNHEPIQYILGETEFYGLKFKVNPSVLIPRPETEELVEWVSPHPLRYFPHKGEGMEEIGVFKSPRGDLGGFFLDIGTGSGCIAVSLKKKFPFANVAAMDISSEALEVARENAKINHLDIEFIQDDILNPAPTDRKWDLIVSNPPYIPASEHSEMDKNVTDFEPHLALFVHDNDPLIFYRKIAEFGITHLSPGGKIFFETHQNLAHECKLLLEAHGFINVEVRKDISGNDRIVRASKKNDKSDLL